MGGKDSTKKKCMLGIFGEGARNFELRGFKHIFLNCIFLPLVHLHGQFKIKNFPSFLSLILITEAISYPKRRSRRERLGWESV